MTPRTIFILGGYGEAGLPIARWLLRETEANLVLAGRTPARGEKVVDQLNAEFPAGRVSWRCVDAADSERLSAALKGVDLLLVCSMTTSQAELVARAALDAGIDYLDVYAAQKVIPVLRALEPEIRARGGCFITQAGFHPGLLAPAIRYGASFFSQYDRAFVSMVMNDRRKVSRETTDEIAEIIVTSTHETFIFGEGQWRPPGKDLVRRVDFGPEFGVRVCYPVWFEEMRILPAELGFSEAGAYIAGFSGSLDTLMLRLVLFLNRLKDGMGTRLLGWLLWRLSPLSSPPFGIRFKLEATGSNDGRPRSLEIMVRHDDPYELTALCTVACLLQYLDGSIRKPGLWLMGDVVDPPRLIKDLERMGVAITIDQ